MVTRRAIAADAPALARLRYEFRAHLAEANETEAAFVARCEAWMRPRLEAATDWWGWVAGVDNVIVGNAFLHRIEKMPNPVTEYEAHGYVTNVYVRPEFRGCGTGALLLEAALSFARDNDFDAIVLWPTARSRTLYERHGFAETQDILRLKLSSFDPHAREH
jgi:GNAT superfamily N-acetyltransferase